MRLAGLQPLAPYVKATAPWSSRCLRCGKIVFISYNKVQQGRHPCSYCAGTKLGVEDRTKVMRVAGLEPLAAYPGSHAHWKCRCCRCARIVRPTYHDVQAGKGGCRWCCPSPPVDPKAAIKAMRAAGLQPLDPYPGSASPWRCRCRTCGKVVTPRYGNVRLRQRGCKFCAQVVVEAKSAEKLMRSKGLRPQVAYPGANKPWACLCQKCDAKLTPSYTAIAAGQTPCKYCAKTRVDPRKAVASMRGWGLEPKEPFPGVQEPWTCTCIRCRRTVRVRYAIARNGRTRCPFCDKTRRTPVVRVDEAAAVRIMRRVGHVEPLVSYPGSALKWRCRCLECRRIVSPTYSNVRAGHRGCGRCAWKGSSKRRIVRG